MMMLSTGDVFMDMHEERLDRASEALDIPQADRADAKELAERFSADSLSRAVWNLAHAWGCSRSAERIGAHRAALQHLDEETAGPVVRAFGQDLNDDTRRCTHPPIPPIPTPRLSLESRIIARQHQYRQYRLLASRSSLESSLDNPYWRHAAAIFARRWKGLRLIIQKMRTGRLRARACGEPSVGDAFECAFQQLPTETRLDADIDTLETDACGQSPPPSLLPPNVVPLRLRPKRLPAGAFVELQAGGAESCESLQWRTPKLPGSNRDGSKLSSPLSTWTAVHVLWDT
eukprot:Polyplicarium_translucidae@DN2310_c0_g2_i1.p1